MRRSPPRRRLPGCYCQARRWGCLFSRYVLAARRRRNARCYLALSGCSSVRWRAKKPRASPLQRRYASRFAAVHVRLYGPRRGRGGRGEVAGRPRAGRARAGAPRAEIGGVGLPLRLPRDRLALRVGVVRPPTALSARRRPTARPRQAPGARLGARRERARELERRGRPGPLATATIQAPRGLEASVAAVLKPDLFPAWRGAASKKELDLHRDTQAVVS